MTTSPDNGRPTTLAQIAEVANVSPATVSKALNERDDISDRTRQIVLKAARRLNYQGPRRQVDHSRTGLRRVGLLSFGISAQTAFGQRPYARLIDGVKSQVAAWGADLVLELDVRDSPPRCCRKRQVDGLLVMGPTSAADKDRLPPDVPVVYSPDPTARLDGVSGAYQDNVGGAAMITRRLLKLGHRRIVFAVHTRHRPVFLERTAGYLQAMHEARLAPAVLDYDVDRDTCLPEMVDRIAGGDWTAVVAVNDNLGAALLGELMMRGVQVPEQLSIVGFDHWRSGGWSAMELTTVDTNLEEVGKHAIQLLNQRVLHPHTTPMRVTVTPKIIEGQTVAPAA